VTDSLDRASDRPLYKQVADLIRARIISGDLPAGASLPSEKQLAEAYSVGGTTIKDALVLLKAEGMVLSERGKPWWVRPISTSMPDRYRAGKRGYQPDVESNFAREHGVPWSQFQLSREYLEIAAPKRVAAALEIPVGSEVCERRWTHAIDGVILRVAWSYLDMKIFTGTVMTDIDEPPWPGGTIAQLRHLGFDVKGVIENVGVHDVNEREAALLGIQAGTTVLERWRTQYVQAQPDTPARPVECARHLFAKRTALLGYEVGVDNPGRGRSWVTWREVAPD
jgi:GntR family transcriptional regulator